MDFVPFNDLEHTEFDPVSGGDSEIIFMRHPYLSRTMAVSFQQEYSEELLERKLEVNRLQVQAS